MDLVLFSSTKGEEGVINPVNFADVLYVWSLSFPVIPLEKKFLTKLRTDLETETIQEGEF